MRRFLQWFDNIRTFIFVITTIAAILVYLDSNLRLNGYLLTSGAILVIVLLIFLFIRYLVKRSAKTEEDISSSYPFEQLCIDFEDGSEIEFTYDNVRYLFIPENGRYYFKRIVSIDPYEYEILAEAENAIACIEASAVNSKKISGFWPDVKDITVY